jgi:predicted glycogen debranching enzyme
VLVRDTVPFRARLTLAGEAHPRNIESTAVARGFVACLWPAPVAGEARLELERYGETEPRVQGALRYLALGPAAAAEPGVAADQGLALLTNDRGGMARLAVDLGAIRSKYDCLLGANLHPSLPVDRHILAKRARVWVNADGFISPLDAKNLARFEAGPPARWQFMAHAGDGRTVDIDLDAWMPPGSNTTVLRFHRPLARTGSGAGPAPRDVRLTVRVDVEDRNFHQETRRNPGAEHHFSQHTQVLPAAAGPDRGKWTGNGSAMGAVRVGFAFTPATDRQLRVWADAGAYHPQPEWAENVAHPVEQSRGQAWGGDAFSPGWFELPIEPGGYVTVVATAEPGDLDAATLAPPAGVGTGNEADARGDSFADTLTRAARAYVVRRDDGRTVIAGYPWFLDWGRDTLICARGLLAAGWRDDVTQLLRVFGRFEEGGTLPNTIHGADASNRDTSDAPLWYGIVCEELAALDPGVHDSPVGSGGRTIRDVLGSIAAGYLRGTRNGISVDPASGLVWSPSHFTWMDTNYPAGTPREGYPLEIQALWIRLLRQLDRLGLPSAGESWSRLAERALDAFERRFWLEADGFYADVLLAGRGQPAAAATPHRALRCNVVFPVALGLVAGPRARRSVAAVQRHLLVPGALRSLAPLPVSPPLPIPGAGGLLNDPVNPYWGRYEGDEDTRRKPAYHNGTAWTWPFPSFCEALVRAWDGAPAAVAAARAWLGGADRLLAAGCVGHLPEVLDGDAPHAQRGCDAQAWGVTEALRVWRWLEPLASA